MFDDSYKVSGDYELLLRAGRQLKAEFVDDVTVKMRIGGVSNSTFRVFTENLRAKRVTGKRNAVSCYIEKLIAIAKYRVRMAIWSNDLKDQA